MRALAALVEGSCVDELSTEANAPLLGHALSLLLQVAEREASAGDRGSRALRAEACRALEVLLQQARICVRCAAEGVADGDATLAQVGDPDALAFFLPGISSGLCLAIRRSTTDAPGVRAMPPQCALRMCGYAHCEASPFALCRAPGQRGES